LKEAVPEIAYNDIGAVVAQFIRADVAGYAQDKSESAAFAGLHTRQSIFDDYGTRRFCTQSSGGFEKRIRLRLAGQIQFGGDVAVHFRVEEIGDAGRLQSPFRIGARCDDRRANPLATQPVQQANRTGEGAHALVAG
jgi:hypothetical protein